MRKTWDAVMNHRFWQTRAGTAVLVPMALVKIVGGIALFAIILGGLSGLVAKLG